ncbi:hypothetical protein OH773_06795 [Buttiauxella sp. WJP83]|uniref:hypothetical protein n=1 Tax=Buttiauxella sp. WJP83 TaxID=2986951 RepID=UPI0022DE7D83|nr:hypothetical protein [Buttiauxella sp. WJP83]WBM71943.1 hypothetical protein OH773_06795 [Buttiauxella sp. WJP83]
MFDLNSVVTGLVHALESIRNEDPEVREEGYKLFNAENNELKGNTTVDSEDFRAVLVQMGIDIPRFQDDFATAEKFIHDRYNAECEQKAELAKATAFASTVIDEMKQQVETAAGTDRKAIIAGVSVDVFIAITNYENNRDVEKRAEKQAKAGAEMAHQTGDTVAIVMLDPVRNAALWERTERVAKEAGLPHTLPFIKVDGHTRAYGWKTPHPKEAGKHLFKRPECLFLTVYKNQEDQEIYQLVQDYCSGVNKATNGELQQMGMKRVEFSPQSDFIKKDSWKTAFRTIKPEYGKDVDLAIETFRDELEAIDAANIQTKTTHRKLSGVRAAMITTYNAKAVGKWRGFWSMFFNPKTRSDLFLDLLEWLEMNSTESSRKVKEKVEEAFAAHTGKPVAAANCDSAEETQVA